MWISSILPLSRAGMNTLLVPNQPPTPLSLPLTLFPLLLSHDLAAMVNFKKPTLKLKLSLGASVVRYISLGLNGLFMLTGILLIALGGSAIDNSIPGFSSKTISSGVIVLGVFIFIIAGVGFIGAVRENRLFLMVYFGTVLLLVLIEFSFGIAGYVKSDTMTQFGDQTWGSLYQNDRAAIDDLENAFHCCGWANVTDRAVPPINSTDPNYCVITKPTFAGLSCEKAMLQDLENSMALAGGAALFIALVQIVLVLFSLYLFVKIPKLPQQTQSSPQELVDEH